MAIVHLSAILDPTVRKKALARIGYFDDTKKRGRQVDYPRLLGWFVEFSRKNLKNPETMNLAVLEVRTLQGEEAGGVRHTGDEASTALHLPQTQATVAQYLEQLTKTGRIEFEEFKISPSIFVPRFRGLSNFPYSICSSEPVEPYHGKGLLYRFYLALKHAGDRLRQCPQCTALFVQARRKQQVCTPRCRMRGLRARQQKEREARKTNRHVRQKKGGKKHGTSTR